MVDGRLNEDIKLNKGFVYVATKSVGTIRFDLFTETEKLCFFLTFMEVSDEHGLRFLMVTYFLLLRKLRVQKQSGKHRVIVYVPLN